MIDIRDDRLFINNILIGDEKYLMKILNEASQFRKIKADSKHAMTESDIAEEEFIANGERHYARTWNLNGGDDF